MTALQTCAICACPVAVGHGFIFRGKSGQAYKCFRHALGHRPMLRRSFIVCLFVGTILTLLNQGDVLLQGEWRNAFYWKIPLTYATPFAVATVGALLNNRN